MDIVAVGAIVRETYRALINIVCRCIVGNDPQTFRCVQFHSEHGYNTRNGHMP